MLEWRRGGTLGTHGSGRSPLRHESCERDLRESEASRWIEDFHVGRCAAFLHRKPWIPMFGLNTSCPMLWTGPANATPLLNVIHDWRMALRLTQQPDIVMRLGQYTCSDQRSAAAHLVSQPRTGSGGDRSPVQTTLRRSKKAGRDRPFECTPHAGARCAGAAVRARPDPSRPIVAFLHCSWSAADDPACCSSPRNRVRLDGRLLWPSRTLRPALRHAEPVTPDQLRARRFEARPLGRAAGARCSSLFSQHQVRVTRGYGGRDDVSPRREEYVRAAPPAGLTPRCSAP